jgi:hypothetical protein
VKLTVDDSSELAAIPCSGAELIQMDPREALTRSRLDLVLKYLFFRSLAGAGDRSRWESFYRRHILDRTNGVEPRDSFQKTHSEKFSVDHYVSGCADLLRSFQSRGFSPSYPIPLGTDQKPLNGAHRIACALATQNPILVAPVQLGCRKPWGFRWFLERGYPPDLLADLLYHYAHLTTKAIGTMILWGPIMPQWRQVMNDLKGKVGLVGWLDFSFEENPFAFESIVHDMYALQWKDLDQANIRRKTILLNQSRRMFRLLLVEDLFDNQKTFRRALTAVRSNVRKSLSHLVPKESFCTCHAAVTEIESSYLVELLLGYGSRKHHALRRSGQPRRQFGEWLFQLARELSRHGLARHDVCIVGSSPLEVIGLRDSTDIDITVTSEARRRFGRGVTHLNSWLDLVTRGYARSLDHAAISDDELINDPRHHFWFRGFKFADVQLVLRRKASQKRPKDLADVRAAEKLLNHKPGKGIAYRSSGTCGSGLISYLVRREQELGAERI